uniref:SPX domain-containing protein n=1 Tax=Angiostrongylus cantonensis TaxID=6313 RepID=A0A0K0DEU4_ANGCA
MAKEVLNITTGVCLRRIKHSKDITETARCLIKAKESLDKLKFTTRYFEILIFKISLLTQAVVPALLAPSTASPVHRVSDLFLSLFTNVSPSAMPTRWSTTYRKMLELHQKLEENKKMPGAQIYNRRIYDIVMDTKQDENSYEAVIPGFLKSVVDVVKSFNKAGNSRILSPRLVPLLPDKASSNGFLSPALFPLYKDETEPQILPIPKVGFLFNVSSLNFVLCLCFLCLVVFLYNARLANLSFQISDSFERLRSSFSKDQSDDLKQRGFTFMRVSQMKKLLKEQGYAIIFDIMHLLLNFSRRSKRQIQPVTVLSPLVLSPYQFAPVFGFTILGPVVLSPNIFSPLILNPSLLGPWVLSPAFPLPFILSPYLLSPYVLSPLVMAPFVLSPYVLSPNVINPYVLSPVILSPTVLCPDVLSPMVLGGPILSPSVLSPGVLSKSFVMASVLSPTLLS